MDFSQKKACVLSISGGGIRGLIAAYILKELEAQLIKKLSDPDIRICQFFDLFAGTSAGGLLTALLLAPLEGQNKTLSANEIYNIFFRGVRSAFCISQEGHVFLSPEKSSQKFNNFLEEIFSDLHLKDLVKPSLITAYEPNRNWLSFFKQHFAKILPEYNFYLRSVVAASGAMPLHFDPVITHSFSDHIVREDSLLSIAPVLSTRQQLFEALKENRIIDSEGKLLKSLKLTHRIPLHLPDDLAKFESTVYEIVERIGNPKMTFIDGAMFANNPAMSAMIEIKNIRQLSRRADDLILVSLGTGINQIYQEYTAKYDRKFSTRMLSMLFSCSEKLSHFQTYNAFDNSAAIANYYEFNPIVTQLPDSDFPTYAINDIRSENIDALITITENYISQMSCQFDRLTDALIQAKKTIC